MIKVRDKSTLKSRLLAIPGVGEATVRTLFEYFKSYDNIAKASFTELVAVNGITKRQAENIKEFFDKN